ncbi:putative ATP-grasp-modified RiPP [Streptomyces sp. NPDC059783]|uniref:putative ATP-grasp-modified RiPP n=1 Tax=Streptomyces sp. NPDC059783 TaxID=3346944 RepID=UPI00365E7112
MTHRPFALQFATVRQPDAATSFSYDPTQQMSFLPDGTPAALAHAELLRTASTSSTAGSKTHSDDD